MAELDPQVLRHAVAPSSSDAVEEKPHIHWHKHADRGVGVVVVDGLDACLREAGEVIQAGLRADQLVELGELIMVKRAFHAEVALGGPGAGGDSMRRWLSEGNVLYKSVGLGLMDVCVGENLVALARRKGIGTQLDDF